MDLPDPGIEQGSLALQVDSLTTELSGKPKVKVKVKVAQSCPTFCDPMVYRVHGILRARILARFPSPGDLPNAGIKPRSPALQADSLPSEPPMIECSAAQLLSRVQLFATP